eukprot:369658_1
MHQINQLSKLDPRRNNSYHKLKFKPIHVLVHFNDIHYMNTYNPWILPIIVTYMFYSIAVIISFAYYSHSHNRCSYICVKITFILYGLLALFVLYILKKNTNNNLSNFSLNGFYGNNMLHCVDFASHKNPIIISIFIIIYVYVTHHIFVCLRAFAAKFCGGEYLSETQFENDNQKRIKMEQKKHRNYAYVYDKNNKSDGNEFQIDINQSKSVDMSEYDEYVDSEEDECHFNGYYMRSRSDSRQNGNKRKSQYLNEPNAGTPEPQLLDMPNQV